VVQAAVQWEGMDFGHPCDEVPGEIEEYKKETEI
jgi:hypothetical protein